MTGLLAHDEAERLRSAIADALSGLPGDTTQAPDPARTALLRVVDVLESSAGAVVLPADALVGTQEAAELLSVTLMGLVIGNMKLVEREELRHFKENLTVVLLSVLFIVIPSQLKFSQLGQLDWRAALFVLSILLVVRPLSIGLATLGSPMRKADKQLLAWIAPRGIVAAASAGIFGPALVDAGYPDAERLLPIVFLVIIATVLAHGLTLARLARHLGLAAGEENGLLIVGASPWSQMLAQALKKQGVAVMVADGAYQRLKPIRMDGIDVYYGEILSEHAHHALETEHLSHLLCATDNDYLLSIMKPVYEPGKFANWIAPPSKGIEGRPVDFEYVKLHD